MLLTAIKGVNNTQYTCKFCVKRLPIPDCMAEITKRSFANVAIRPTAQRTGNPCCKQDCMCIIGLNLPSTKIEVMKSNTPVLSNCPKVLQPIPIARFGTTDKPNLALADNDGYRALSPKKENGRYETK